MWERWQLQCWVNNPKPLSLHRVRHKCHASLVSPTYAHSGGRRPYIDSCINIWPISHRWNWTTWLDLMNILTDTKVGAYLNQIKRNVWDEWFHSARREFDIMFKIEFFTHDATWSTRLCCHFRLSIHSTTVAINAIHILSEHNKYYSIQVGQKKMFSFPLHGLAPLQNRVGGEKIGEGGFLVVFFFLAGGQGGVRS